MNYWYTDPHGHLIYHVIEGTLIQRKGLKIRRFESLTDLLTALQQGSPPPRVILDISDEALAEAARQVHALPGCEHIDVRTWDEMLRPVPEKHVKSTH